MQRTTIGLIIAATAFAFVTAPDTSCWAQQPPAVQQATGAQKQRISQLIAKAKKEGALSYWDVVIQPPTNDALVKAFKKYYGLPSSFTVHYTLSKSSNLITRVNQELSAGHVTMDIASVASLPWVLQKVSAGKIMHYESPQYKLYKKAFARDLGKDGYFAFDGAYLFVPMWNADKLKFKGTSYKDVLGAVPKGRISIGNVGKSATYLATYFGQTKVLNQAFFKKLAAMHPAFLVRSEEIASRLVSGQDLMAYSGMPTRAYQFNKRGANLKFLIPKKGVVLMPQATFILKKAPHPAAAKLWVDFILSEQGQKILVKHEALISGRAGFKSPLPEYAPSIDSLHVIKIDWGNVSVKQLLNARKSWVKMFNP